VTFRVRVTQPVLMSVECLLAHCSHRRNRLLDKLILIRLRLFHVIGVGNVAEIRHAHTFHPGVTSRTSYTILYPDRLGAVGVPRTAIGAWCAPLTRCQWSAQRAHRVPLPP